VRGNGGAAGAFLEVDGGTADTEEPRAREDDEPADGRVEGAWKNASSTFAFVAVGAEATGGGSGANKSPESLPGLRVAAIFEPLADGAPKKASTIESIDPGDACRVSVGNPPVKLLEVTPDTTTEGVNDVDLAGVWPLAIVDDDNVGGAGFASNPNTDIASFAAAGAAADRVAILPDLASLGGIGGGAFPLDGILVGRIVALGRVEAIFGGGGVAVSVGDDDDETKEAEASLSRSARSFSFFLSASGGTGTKPSCAMKDDAFTSNAVFAAGVSWPSVTVINCNTFIHQKLPRRPPVPASSHTDNGVAVLFTNQPRGTQRIALRGG